MECSHIIGVAAWVSFFTFIIAICKAGSDFEDHLDELNHLDRPVNVQANRVLYASADAWPDHVLN